MYAKQRKREANLFLFVWKRYAPVNGSAAIRMFARNERSTLFSACITICSIRSRQSLKLFDARVIDAPPPPSPPPPAPPSHHRRRHRCYPRRTAIGHSSVQRTSVNSSAPLWLTSSLWILYFMIANVDRAMLYARREKWFTSRDIKKILLNQCVPQAAVNNIFERDSRYRQIHWRAAIKSTDIDCAPEGLFYGLVRSRVNIYRFIE